MLKFSHLIEVTQKKFVESGGTGAAIALVSDPALVEKVSALISLLTIHDGTASSLHAV